MSDNNDEELEVYTYQGMDGEKVPKTAEKLIVNSGVRILPDSLCCNYNALRQVILHNGLTRIGAAAFYDCYNLSEISICNTVQFIGLNAFGWCRKLTKVEFEHSTSSPHQLQTIDVCAFSRTSLPRIKLHSSVTTVGKDAFEFGALIEANLSSTSITQLPRCVFFTSKRLQTVSLPNTLERIGDGAFYCCPELVTVIVPLNSQPIKIESGAFLGCKRLANVVLPKGSTANDGAIEGAFTQCDLLHERYGEDSSRIIDGLVRRFENLSIHRMCYDHERVTVEELRQCIADHQQMEDSFVDNFQMTPFHVFFSTPEPSVELLEVLLDLLPYPILLNSKDANERLSLDYLIHNWDDGTTLLLQRTLQKWMVDRLSCWGATSWMEAMERKVQELIGEDDEEQRALLLNNAYSALEHYESIECTSILEMALWKSKLKSGKISDGGKRQTLDRGECRCVCGSDIVIPNVISFLLA